MQCKKLPTNTNLLTHSKCVCDCGVCARRKIIVSVTANIPSASAYATRVNFSSIFDGIEKEIWYRVVLKIGLERMWVMLEISIALCDIGEDPTNSQ